MAGDRRRQRDYDDDDGLLFSVSLAASITSEAGAKRKRTKEAIREYTQSMIIALYVELTAVQ